MYNALRVGFVSVGLWMVVGSWLIVIVARVWVLLCELAWCGVLVGYPSSGVSFHHAMGFGCSYAELLDARRR